MIPTWDNLLTGFDIYPNVFAVHPYLFSQIIDSDFYFGIYLQFIQNGELIIEFLFYATVIMLQGLIFFGLWYWLVRGMVLRVTHLWR